jgi:hypothetical protein
VVLDLYQSAQEQQQQEQEEEQWQQQEGAQARWQPCTAGPA